MAGCHSADSIGPSRPADAAPPPKLTTAGPFAAGNTRHYATKARRALHAQWAVRIHFPLEQERICELVHGALYRSDASGRHPEPGELPAASPARHLSQRQISKPPQRKASKAEAHVPQAQIPGDTEGSVGDCLDSPARLAGR